MWKKDSELRGDSKNWRTLSMCFDSSWETGTRIVEAEN